MHLKQVKLAGFKSFVDPTVLNLRNQLIAIVGPNGCGKSNIIDAVRWVMGESSAKHLRGEAMDDVIFNGSSTRKPVSQAVVELLFDNSMGKIGGEYASYAEIAVRRELARDGQSIYYLNNVRCRKKDVTDIFLGTGLGSKGYSIIEQGMISRVIEAKAEDLRNFLEEAAGISVYKRRRHETELRMHHTKENLARVADLLEEQLKLVNKLNRQAEVAQKFQELKSLQDKMQLELSALKWQSLDGLLFNIANNIKERELELETILVQTLSIDNCLIQAKEQHAEKNHVAEELQKDFYELKHRITKTEELLKHHELRDKELNKDLESTKSNLSVLEQDLIKDAALSNELKCELDRILPELKQKNEEVKALEGNVKSDQAVLYEAGQALHDTSQKIQISQHKAEIEKTKVITLEKQIHELLHKKTRQEEELKLMNTVNIENNILLLSEEVGELDRTQQESQQHAEELLSKIKNARIKLKNLEAEFDHDKNKYQTLLGKEASLIELQKRTITTNYAQITTWLKEIGIESFKKFLEEVVVEPGYELAFETVCYDYLDAVYSAEFVLDNKASILSNAIHSMPQGLALLFNNNTNYYLNNNHPDLLMHKLKTDINMQGFLSGIYVAHDLAKAMEMQDKLIKENLPYRFIITKDGLYIGANFIKRGNQDKAKLGALLRLQEIETLAHEIAELKQKIANSNTVLTATRELISSLEHEQHMIAEKATSVAKNLRERSSKLSSEKTRLQHVMQRKSEITQEIREQTNKIQENQNLIASSRVIIQEVMEELVVLEQKKAALIQDKQAIKEKVDLKLAEYKKKEAEYHAINIQKEQVSAKLNGMMQTLERVERQIAAARITMDKLIGNIAENRTPIPESRAQLGLLLNSSANLEEKISVIREELHELIQLIKQQEALKEQNDSKASTIKDEINMLKLEQQGFHVKQAALNELFVGKDVKSIIQDIAPDITEETLETRLNQNQKAIDRLGAINLAALEEYGIENTKLQTLKSQYDDLIEAAATLTEAIGKIDRETKNQFQSVFDVVNNNFKALFPKLFGGGEAYLALEGDDLLNAGVTVMARPPGKKNSSIHLLSGGEKALTAVSLVFAIFQLNPAPFCMLDEVDAPLDEANVGRFCDMLKAMVEKVQFVVITHNKVTMAAADMLAGVTMKEPGVSRLVAVDLKEAYSLVDA